MNKILTISDNDTNRVGYAVILTKFSREHIQRNVAKGLIKGWYFIENKAEDIAKDNEAYEVLKESGSANFGKGRYMVCITPLSEECADKEESIDEMGIPSDGGDDKDRNPHYSAFNSIVVKADVDWDLYGEDEDVPTRYHEEFSSEWLKVHGFLEEDGGSPLEWIFKEEDFKDWFSDHLSAEMGYCHNGFSFYYTIKR